MDRYNGAVVVDGRVLLDGGAPLLPHMHRLGVDPGDISVVFITHFHGDHTLGLPPFVLHRVWPQFKVRYVTAKPSGTVAGIKYESIKLDHGTMGSNGYRIHVNGKVVAYSGDTEPTAPLDKLVDGADAAIVEATGPGDVFSHMSWEAATKLRKRHPDTRFFFNHVYSGTVTGAVKDFQVIKV